MPTSSAAVELIVARLRQSGDFPAMAKTVESISALTSSDETSISALADTVLQFISALFHNLGRTLAALYLPGEIETIRDETEHNEDAAVVRVLGLSYASLGAAGARALNLPPRLQQRMNRVLGPQAHPGMADDERLACLATLSNGITDALATHGSAKMKKHAIDKLEDRQH